MPAALRLHTGVRSKVIDDAAMNGPATSSAIEVKGFSALRLDIETTRVAYTTIAVSATQSDDSTFPAGSTYTITEVQAGGATAAFTSTFTTSASQKYTLVLNVAGMKYVKLSITGASAGATDKVTVYAAAARGQ